MQTVLTRLQSIESCMFADSIMFVYCLCENLCGKLLRSTIILQQIRGKLDYMNIKKGKQLKSNKQDLSNI